MWDRGNEHGTEGMDMGWRWGWVEDRGRWKGWVHDRGDWCEMEGTVLRTRHGVVQGGGDRHCHYRT